MTKTKFDLDNNLEPRQLINFLRMKLRMESLYYKSDNSFTGDEHAKQEIGAFWLRSGFTETGTPLDEVPFLELNKSIINCVARNVNNLKRKCAALLRFENEHLKCNDNAPERVNTVISEFPWGIGITFNTHSFGEVTAHFDGKKWDRVDENFVKVLFSILESGVSESPYLEKEVAQYA